MPVRALAKRYQKHPNTIRTILHTYKPGPLDLNSLSKEKNKLSLLQSWTLLTLVELVAQPKACVIDDRKGVAEDLEDAGILVQMCHFHMWQIVKRYIAGEPLLTPNIELKSIMNWFRGEYTHKIVIAPKYN